MNNHNNYQNHQHQHIQQYQPNDQRFSFLQDQIQKFPSNLTNPNLNHQIFTSYNTQNKSPEQSKNSLSPNNKRGLDDEENPDRKKMKILFDDLDSSNSLPSINIINDRLLSTTLSNINNNSNINSSNLISPRSSNSGILNLSNSSTISLVGPSLSPPLLNQSLTNSSNSTTTTTTTSTATSGASTGTSTRRRKNEIICAICEKPNNLLMCDGQCLRSFHVECLGLKGVQPNFNTDQQWECDDCVNDQNICFSCKQRGIIGMDLMKCKVHQCGKFYHYKCVSEFKLAKLINTKTPRFNCPLHYCGGCGVSGDGKQSVHCVRCPTAYHVICMPPGVKMLTKSKETRKTGLVICPKHLSEQYKQQQLQLQQQQQQQQQQLQHQQQQQQQQPSNNKPLNVKITNSSNSHNHNSNMIDSSNPLYSLIFSTSPVTTPLNTPLNTPSVISPNSSPSFSPIESPRYFDNKHQTPSTPNKILNNNIIKNHNNHNNNSAINNNE
ncbi:PHD zinc finger-containing protein [Tieghemostelium lacteum]|uniref:PHD zinc finger-containing protein n=1 Tax=Tieghemostelium lacteum TaxID=361077 RepID=A0A151Z6N5_TIELA|nr:PHD zinc finger-containing protein [Tieghemostelium lacteum]|eukprot:KYQ89629.1 PHD zinc finger-containing protein [Tieghemostelium lacteum]